MAPLLRPPSPTRLRPTTSKPHIQTSTHTLLLTLSLPHPTPPLQSPPSLPRASTPSTATVYHRRNQDFLGWESRTCFLGSPGTSLIWSPSLPLASSSPPGTNRAYMCNLDVLDFRIFCMWISFLDVGGRYNIVILDVLLKLNL
ncbi:hypothetical protein DVH24_042016 [Malus domestica]|uniref:Uncharacterized protein n=1 Tax=Malus domestica TaxID=3750 RepID=A0A498INY8_MALDO|nr:hypothetical protein DVH24_042016 [Malus domestica]